LIRNIVRFFVNKGGGGQWIMKKSISVGIPDKSLPENIMIAPEIVLMRFHHIGSLEELEGYVEIVIFVLDGCG